MSNRTRLILFVCFSLVLGAFANVMVAWRCAMLSPITTPPAAAAWIKNPDGSFDIPEVGGLGLQWAEPRKHVVFDYALNEWTPAVGTTPICTVGLPFLSMCWYPNPVRFDAEGVRKPPWNRLHGRMLVGLDPNSLMLGTVTPERRIPLYPVWPGFLFNTVLYAAVVWGLVGGYGRVQRILRVRRRCCAECGYPIGLSPVCTECGRPVPVDTLGKPLGKSVE